MPKISQLPAASSLSNTDILMVDTYGGTNSRKIAYGDLKSNIQEDSKAVFALKGETATDAQVSTAVSNWLSSHVTPTGSAVAIDDTLTIAGAAADAQAAGAARGKIVIATTSATSTRLAYATTINGIDALTEGLTFYLYNNTILNTYTRTDSIPTGEWSSPTALVENSLDTYNSAVVYLYQRASSTPSKPSSSLTYTFSSGALSGSLGNWSKTIPTGTNKLYVTAATAYSRSTTDTITAAEWAAPVETTDYGTTAATGLNAVSVFLYQRASSAPSKPSGSITYTFATGAVSGSTLGSWTTAIPEAGTGSCYEIHATALLGSQQASLNLNSLGAKPIFNCAGEALQDASFQVGDLMLVTYSTIFSGGGCWIARPVPVIGQSTGYASVAIRNADLPPTASGRASFAGGAGTNAYGNFSFAYGTYSTGNAPSPTANTNAFAFGIGAQATGNGAFCLGQLNVASGGLSFTMGSYNQAKGSRSIATGVHTIAGAARSCQSVFGMANVEDTEGKYLFIVGNGEVIVGSGTAFRPETINRSNAFALDWGGNLELAGGITLGGETIAPSTARKIIDRANGFAYNIYTSIDEFAFGNIDSETGADASTGSLTAVRMNAYIPVNAGDVVQFTNTSIYRCYVGEYFYENGSYIYQGALKLSTDTSVTEIAIERDAYIRVVVNKISGNIASSADITANRSAVEQAIASYKLIRYGGVSGSYDDEFEWGSLLVNDLDNGILGNDSDYYSHRSKHLYKVEGSNLLGVVFNSEDIGLNENITVYVLHYNFDFTAMKVVSRYIDRNNPNFSSLIYDGYPYAAVFVQRETTQTTQFHAAKIVADKFISTSYLPDAPYTDMSTSVIMIRAIAPRYNALGFNYKVFGSTMASGRLRLPPNYSMTGKKVPMVVYVHGGGAVMNWESTLTNTPTSARAVNTQYLMDEGYAVFDCYPWGNQSNIDFDANSPLLMPLHCRAYIEGIKYVCKRFNVDIDNVSVLATSQGGYIGHWAYIQSEFPFRAVGLFAPTTDPIPQKTNELFYNEAERQAMCNVINFEGTDEEKTAFITSGLTTNSTVMSFVNKNKAKIVSLSPYTIGIQGSTSVDELLSGAINTLDTVPQWILDEGCPERQAAYDLIGAFAAHSEYSKYAKCPVKFWCAFDDAQTSSYANYAMHRYLLNGGSDSEFRVMPLNTGGHNATSPAVAAALKTSGITALGFTYTNMALAWVEFVEFIRQYT